MKLTSQSKRDLILKAAEGIFLKKGFFPTRVEDIARAAKVAKGTVYLYFSDKESIYLALFAQKIDEGISFLEKVIKSNYSAKEKLTQIFDDWLGRFAQSEGLPSFFTVENINIADKVIKRTRKEIFPRVRKMVRLVAKIIQEGIKEEKFRPLDPEIASLTFLHLLHVGLLYQAFTKGLRGKEKFIKEIFFKGVER
ncbi:MAG: TetR/AcrR family transcriptional regulator [candidate division WOR-3 bacterium]